MHKWNTTKCILREIFLKDTIIWFKHAFIFRCPCQCLATSLDHAHRYRFKKIKPWRLNQTSVSI